MSGKIITLSIPAPNAKQRLFLEDKHKLVAFGGARGGGKSWAVRAMAVCLALRYAGIKIMIVRRTYPELNANHITPLRELLPQALAKYNDSKKMFRFYNGSTILLRYCESESDAHRYQGTEVDILFLEEATQLSEMIYQMFTACVRGVNTFPKLVRLTCNPGGVGHAWVKRLFVDRAYNAFENAEDYGFIQSLVTDNTALMRSSPDYIKTLDALPPKLRDAWRYGRWDIFEGQFFEEFRNSPNEELSYTHVIHAFKPPKSWKRFRSYDWGYGKPFSCGWWAVDHEGRYYRILELYGCDEQPNEGLKWTQDKQFEEIARIEASHPYLAGLDVGGVADPSIWDKSRGGVSTADMAARQGLYFEKGDNKRIPGWMQMHYRMRFDADGRPMMYIFDTCKDCIRTLPLLCYDKHIPEDLDSEGEDHIADEIRYFCMLNPMKTPIATEEKKTEYDPLDRQPLARTDSEYFFRV